jgi:hypothetical protein
VDRFAAAVLTRVAAMFGIEQFDSAALDTPIFDSEGYGIGGRTLDSLDIALLLVTLEEELGIRLVGGDDLEAARTIREFAARTADRCNPGALDTFCLRWASAAPNCLPSSATTVT